MPGPGISLSLSVAMAAGIGAQIVARHVRIPGIVLLLALGVALGPEGAGLVRPGALGSGLHAWVHFAVAIILFEGGMNLDLNRLRHMRTSLRRLLILGGLVTWIGGAAAAGIFLGWPVPVSLLFGSLVVVTGPTVVAPLMRDLRFQPGVRSVLEAEGVLIDPIGALLAALMLQMVLVPESRMIGVEVAIVALRFGVGLAAGAAGGFALATILRSPSLVPRGMENVLALAVVTLLFHAADHFLAHSGIVAVTVAGMVFGNVETRVDRDLRDFKDQLSVLLIGFVFVLLAADVRLSDIQRLGSSAWMVVFALVVVVRPVAVALSTWATEIPWRERVLASVVAPRGIIAAAVASSTAATLDREGFVLGDELRALVFLTIAVTVALAGVIAAPLGTLLQLRLGPRRAVALLGAQGLGLLLGEELRRAGRDVVVLDDNPRSCHRAKAAGFRVAAGDALSEQTLLAAGIEQVEIAVGLTSNDHLNTLFAGTCCQLYAVPKGYVALAGSGTGTEFDQVRRFHGAILFGGPHDRARWDVRYRSRQAETVRVHPVAAAEPSPDAATSPAPPDSSNGDDLFAVLGYERDGRFEIMTRGCQLRPSDICIVAIYAPLREQALAALAAAGFGPPLAADEKSAEAAAAARTAKKPS